MHEQQPLASTPLILDMVPELSDATFSGTLRTIYRNDGIRGFYRGLGPTIFGYLPTWAIYFTVYDGCKEFLASRGGTRQRAEEDFLNHILSALTAGGASTICTSPLWVVKTRFMVSSSCQLWWL